MSLSDQFILNKVVEKSNGDGIKCEADRTTNYTVYQYHGIVSMFLLMMVFE